MAHLHRETDADPRVLQGRRVAVIGYGNLGRPLALNLQDSGVSVVVGARNPANIAAARREGLNAMPVPDAAAQADVFFLLLPDEAMPEVYYEHISGVVQPGTLLVFASAYNIRFGYIEPPAVADVGLIAPRTLGPAVRQRYLSGQGYFSFVSVAQDATGQAWPLVLALAGAAGALRAGALEIPFEREANLDLFVQQAVLPAFQQVMAAAADLLIERGYEPEAVFAELYVSGAFGDFVSRAQEQGLFGALRATSTTGQYGTLSRLPRYKHPRLTEEMVRTLADIENGSFVREWSSERVDFERELHRLYGDYEEQPLWQYEQQTIELLHSQPVITLDEDNPRR